MSDKTSAPRIEFNCGGNSSPAYSCNKPGDNSGTYVQATDYDEVVNRVKVLEGLLSDMIEQFADYNPYTGDLESCQFICVNEAIKALEADNG